MNLSSSLRQLLVLLATTLGSVAFAQNAAILQKSFSNLQTDTNTVTLDPSARYEFAASVDGTPTTPTPPIRFTIPNNSAAISLTYDTSNQQWVYGQSFASQAVLNASFPSGTYLYTLGGKTISVPFSGDLYPSAPVGVFSNGTFSNGALVVDRTKALNITINFPVNFVAGLSRLGIQVGGPGFTANLGVDTTSTLDKNTLTLTVPANMFQPGGTYRVLLEANRVVNLDTTSLSGYLVGGVYSATTNVTITVPAPAALPVFLQQPANFTATAGSTVTFSSSLQNAAGATYQWRKGGVAISGATSATLTLTNVQPSDAGTYTVVATNSVGSSTSSAATLTVNVTPPFFTRTPTAQTVATGSTAVFSVVSSNATGYQWRKDGNPIAGATTPLFVLSNVTVASAGSYSCAITNSAGSNTSNVAPLNILTTTDGGRLSNLSIRTNAGTGDQSLLVGMAVGGPGNGKPVLIRVTGPALIPFGVTGTLVDPAVTLLRDGATVAFNDNWGGSDTLANVFTSVGAFGLTDRSGRDAVIYATSLASATYAIKVTGTDGGTGIALAELYDATPGGSFNSNTTQRLINVSARAQVDTGDGVLIVGFAISGTTSKTVLIRAIGPTLTGFGVNGALANPVLELTKDGSQVALNDDWGGDPQLTSVGNGVGAFALTVPSSKDSMLLITLSPGTYSAKVSGVSSTTGVCLVELYDIP